jgi:hypothetical protein
MAINCSCVSWLSAIVLLLLQWFYETIWPGRQLCVRLLQLPPLLSTPGDRVQAVRMVIVGWTHDACRSHTSLRCQENGHTGGVQQAPHSALQAA